MKTIWNGGCTLLLSGMVSVAMAEAVKDREGAVRQDKASFERDARWAYNDVSRGFEESKRSGKPLLVVLRCVPCLACAGIDASVLNDPSLQPLLDEFVCVRVINANSLDLSLFQFDYDLSFSAVFFSPDGTVYGRYGSWSHQKNAQDKTTAGFQRALDKVLALHRQYPTNKATLSGKQPISSPYKTPVNIPTLSGKYRLELDWQGKVVPSCVHCHQIGDALRTVYRHQNEPVPSHLIYPMPGPETLGLSLAPDQIATIEAVLPGSIAASVGLQPHDEIRSMEGQPLVSVADLSWVLHRAQETGEVRMAIQRQGVERELTMKLPPGWRSKSDISRRVGTWEMRAMALGGLQLESLDDAMRKHRAIPSDTMALQVKHAGEYGKHAAARKAGFRKDDVLIEVAGLKGRITEGELIGHLLQNYRRGEQIKVKVLRGTEHLELMLPAQ